MKTLMFVLVTSLLLASNGFAATNAATSALVITDTGLELHASDTATGSSATSPLIGKCSTGVGIGWNTATTGYALATQHKNGSKVFGTSFDSTSLYAKDVATIGTTEFDSALTKTDTTDFSGDGWKAL